MGGSTSKFKKALQQGNEVVAFQIYVQNPDIRERLNPNIPYDYVEQNSLLHYVARYCMKSLLRDFIKRGGNPNFTNKHGQTCLHMLMTASHNDNEADSQKRLDCLHLLLRWKGRSTSERVDERLDVSALDKNKKTALHYAAASGLLLCVQRLLSEKCSLFAKDIDGLTACDLAEEHHHFTVAAVLEAKMVFSLEKGGVSTDVTNPILDYDGDQYFGLCALDLQESKDQLIVETSDMLKVPLFTAEALLQKHSWSREKVLESWMKDPIAICEKAGVELSPDHSTVYPVKNDANSKKRASSSPTFQSEDVCNICEETIFNESTGTVTKMSCGHVFCDECWDRYLSSKISSGQTHNLLCPGHQCDKLVPVEMTEKLVSRDMAKVYLQFDIKAFVDTNPNYRWCPHPNCGRAIKVSETSASLNESKQPSVKAKSVDCGNGHFFCWLCLEDAHEPCSCEEWQKWNKTVQEINPQKEQALSEERSTVATAYWLVTNSKKCPNCMSHIQKNEGCNHMTCYKCKHDFCWVCMEPWKIHSAETGGYFRCNRFEVVKKREEEQEREQEMMERDHDKVQRINRFMHYYTRCKNHENSFQLEVRLLNAVKDKMVCLQKTASELGYFEKEGDAENDCVQFLEDAVKELLRSRQILKGSYPYGFFLNNLTGEMVVFEFMQDEVEQATESLSHMIAQRYLKSTRSQIINATAKLSRKRREFISAIKRGLIPADVASSSRNVDQIVLRRSRQAINFVEEETGSISGSSTQDDNSRFQQLILPEGLLTFQTEGLRTISSNMLDIVRVDDSEEELDETRGLAERTESIVVAEFDYIPDPETTNELAIEAGDVITVLQRRNDGWWKGRCNGKEGFFPSSFAVNLEDNAPDRDEGNLIAHATSESSIPERFRRLSLGPYFEASIE